MVAPPAPMPRPDDEARLRALGDVPSLILWQTRPDGSMSGAGSPAWQAFTGQSASECEGFGWTLALHPDDRARVHEAWQRAVDALQPFEGSYRLRRHDGQYRFVTSQGVPSLQDGVVREWVGLCADVSAALDLHAALRASEEQIAVLARIGEATRALTDATEVMAVTARLLGEHLHATRCAYADVDDDSNGFTIRADWAQPGVPSSAGNYSLDLFGPQATSRLRRGRPLIVNDVDAELGDDGGGQMFKAIGIRAIVCAGLVKDGRLVAMMAVHQAQPRRWTAQELAIIAEVVDRCWAHIERVRDNAALREQDRRKTEFLAVLAHELRNPLAPMRYALAILRANPDAARRQQAEGVLERQTAQMARLIDDLIDLSRINRGVLELRMHDVPLRGLVDQAIETVAPMVDAAGHRLRVERPPAGLQVRADPERLVQVLSNLLTNAAKYTPPAGSIDVGCVVAGGRVEVSVTDSGIGIAPQDQRRVFEMFTQVSPHTTGAGHGGLGIGLALAQDLMAMHDGRVSLHSEGVGRGSRFAIELPCVVPAGGPDRAMAGPARDGQAAAPLRVLVAEDHVDGRAMLVDLLRLAGHSVEGVGDGASALAAFTRLTPNLVLLDLGLPVLDGVAVARALRALEAADAARPRARIVALTGWGMEADRRRTDEAGFDAHLTKPVDPQALTQQIAAASDG